MEIQNPSLLSATATTQNPSDNSTKIATTEYVDAASGGGGTGAAYTAFATGGQGSATPLTTTINNITVCAADGDSVLLPAATAGSEIQVSNLGANYANVFPQSGELIDALAVNIAVSLPVGEVISFICAVNGSWQASSIDYPGSKYSIAVCGSTFAPGHITGAHWVIHENSGIGSLTSTRSAAQMFNDDPYSRVGGTFNVRIIQGGVKTMTVGAGSGVTLTGTNTILTGTFRDFSLKYVTATTMTMTEMGTSEDQTYTTVSDNYTILHNDHYIEQTVAGKTVTLIAAQDIKSKVYIIDNSSAGDITLDTFNVDTINGDLTVTIPTNNSLKVVSNGVNWRII